MTAFIPTIVPFVNFVVRPYFCTESPNASVTATDFRRAISAGRRGVSKKVCGGKGYCGVYFVKSFGREDDRLEISQRADYVIGIVCATGVIEARLKDIASDSGVVFEGIDMVIAEGIDVRAFFDPRAYGPGRAFSFIAG